VSGGLDADDHVVEPMASSARSRSLGSNKQRVRVVTWRDAGRTNAAGSPIQPQWNGEEHVMNMPRKHEYHSEWLARYYASNPFQRRIAVRRKIAQRLAVDDELFGLMQTLAFNEQLERAPGRFSALISLFEELLESHTPADDRRS
jgi:hypothetical protein